MSNQAITGINAAQAGLTIVADLAARDAFYATTANRTKLVYVNNNNGSPDDAANGVYEYVGGARLADGYYNGLALAVQPLVDDAEAAAASAQAAAGVVDPINGAPRVGVLGDSIIQANHNPYAAATNMYGEFFWLQSEFPYFNFDVWRDDAITDGLRYFDGLNQGYSGETSADMLPRVQKLLSMSPDVVCVAIGTNDLGDGTAPAATMANIETLCEAILAAGIPVKLANIRPVLYGYGSVPEWNNGGTYQVNRLTLNGLIAAYAAATPGVELVDLSAAYGGNQPANIADLLRDGLHPFPQGAFLGAIYGWLPALRKNIKSIPANTVLYVEDTNAVSNGAMAGSGGEKEAGRVTGDVADNWFAPGGSATTTITASKVTAGQKFVIDPGAGSGTESFRIQPGDSNYPEYLPFDDGQFARAFAEIEISDWGGFQQIRLDGFGGSGAGYGVDVDPLRNLDLDGARKFTLISPPLLIPATPNLLPTLRVFYNGAASGTGEIIIKRFWIGLVPDPRPLFGF
ncbi:SGNH/GDSL hydrolase family protein [Sphingopyxis fribergensis]|uniref:SGNH/GDSL hydrolase family protein n=1 Tax=Sphingopyxis fribergensis TaxID=1515612 RepID=UPI00068F0C32|nr:SGNH/GDSL hydrolase family protein [Sphingopyxis fribergensis]